MHIVTDNDPIAPAHDSQREDDFVFEFTRR